MNAPASASYPDTRPDYRRYNADDARAAIRRALREMGTMLRQTRAPELGWLATPKALWPDAPYEQLGLKDRAEQAEAGGEPTVRIIEARLLPDQIDRAQALLERVMRMRPSQRIVVVGWSVKVHMGVLAKHVHVSRRTAWSMLGGACDVLWREGFGRE